MRHAAETASDALAVVGMSCRLPGGLNSPDEFWSALRAGRDVIGEPPPGRFDPERFLDADPQRPGKTYTFAGGYLADIAGFDAEYFGISPREAHLMDPQQRLLLEMTAEAFDDAGIARSRVAGSDTGVFVGMSDLSYAALQQSVPRVISSHSMSGAALSMAANRLSYVFDLRGPSMTVDTACSSALVAMHQACEGLRTGRLGLAVVGGVNLLLNPYNFVGFSKATMLSKKGRCASFSAEADGYVRAEGGGIVVLKRLCDAVADGDRVHAVVLGSGTNADGRASGALVPAAETQAALLRGVYGGFGIDPDDLVYFEAHGTGTPIGDPVECEAIGRALGTRRGAALPLGSVKTNLGHLEPASGIAGVLKAVLVLRHGTIPASLHADPLDPAIDFDGMGLEVVRAARRVDVRERSVVGVNSFGFGGANAHVILGAAPNAAAAALPADPATRPLPLVVSARTREALVAAVKRTAERLDATPFAEFYDACYTAARRREQHPYRAAVLAETPSAAAELLSALATDDAAPGSGPASTGKRVAFAFAGNGTQWAGMGAQLLREEPVFAVAVREVDAALAPLLGWSVAEKLAATTEPAAMTATEVAQPALFALQVGLVALLAEYGVRPSAVVGYSVGEVAAAHVSGALDLETAARVIVERSRIQGRTAGQGRMAAIGLGAEGARELLAAYGGRLEIAGINAADHVTISGDGESLRALATQLSESDVFVRELDLDYAFHSHVMDPTETDQRGALADIVASRTRVPLVSTVTGAPIEGPELTGDYWWRNIRQPVRFAAAARHLVEQGVDTVVEIGPDAALKPYLRRAGATAVPTMTRSAAGGDAVRAAVATVIANGVEIDWSGYFPLPGRVVDLPAYPWQRERYWQAEPSMWLRSVGDGNTVHPLLGDRVPVAEPTWHNEIERARLPWLGDHLVDDTVVIPAAGYIEMALAAGRQRFDSAAELDTLDIPTACALPWDSEMDMRLQTSLSDEDGVLRIASQSDSKREWRLHARGRVRPRIGRAPNEIDPTAFRESAATRIGGDEFYDRLDATRLSCGPTFRLLHELWTVGDKVLARYSHDLPDNDFEAHPAVLDAALQAGVPLLPGMNESPGAAARTAYLPISIGRARVWARPTPHGFIHVRLRSRVPREVCWDVLVTDESGQVTVEMSECRVRRVGTIADGRPTELVTVPLAAPRHGQEIEASALPEPSEVLTGAEEAIAELRATKGTQVRAVLPLIRRLSACCAVSAFRTLLGDRSEFATVDLMEASVLPKYAKLVDVFVGIAREHGLVTSAGAGTWRIVEAPAPEPVLAEVLWQHPDDAAAAMLYGRFGLHLVDILSGRSDPLDLAFQDSGSEIIEWFYEKASLPAFYNGVARDVVRSIAETIPADRSLRILEVGAGTGGTTSAVLPVVPSDRTSYVFTDVSSSFFPRAQERFADHGFVDYRQLDLNQDFGEQGFAPGQFDLIIASNALHATTELGSALQRLGELLTDGGQLLVYEAHDTSLLALAFGLFDAFWAFTDIDLRTASPLVAADRWPSLLRESGFDDVIQIGLTDDEEPESSVLLARRRRDASPARTRPAGDGVTRWLIAAESPADADLFVKLGRELAEADCVSVDQVEMSTDSDVWFDLVPPGEGPVDVVLLFGAGESEPEDIVRSAAVIRAVADAAQRVDAEVTCWLVLPSAEVEIGSGTVEPVSAAVWGMARSVANESHWMELNRIALERGTDSAADARRLSVELLDPDDEDEIMLTPRGRFVPRLRQRPAGTLPVGADTDRPYTLALRDQGLSYRLAWVESTAPRLGPDEVLVEVRAAALNYRDMMVAVGLLPPVAEAEGHIESEQLLGLECAGVVCETGSQVTDLRVGDRVFGMTVAAFGSHTVASARSVARIPEGMSFAAAATIPIAYLTVHYGLGHLASLAPGETVLVHGAAGGVGLAAIRFAELCGARVIATAGSPAKRDCLRMLGIRHVLDSRSMEFADEVREITGGRGVDVVLNSLSGDGIARGLEVLGTNGRFVELGKRDIYGNSRMLMGTLRKNISFFAVDIGNLPLGRPDLAADQFAEVARRLDAGEYRPLPHQSFAAAGIDDAFRLMQHSRHVGKLVVCFDEPVPVERTALPSLAPDGTYLVTGGLGGFAFAAARRLAERGARHLALVGRRGPATPGAEEKVAELAALGTEVSVYAADVADRDAMRAVFQQIDDGGYPVRGVVHAAMHLDDEILIDLDDDRFRAVLSPKIGGGLVLDELTRGRDLDFFVVFSSGSVAIGNVKQSAYVAANAALEALVRVRRRRGEPALAIQWGAISDVGYAARTGISVAFERFGIGTATAQEALDIFDRLLGCDDPVVTVANFEWGQASEFLPVLKAPRTAGLLPPEIEGTGYRVDQLVERIRAESVEARRRLVDDTLAQLVAVVLQTTPDRLDRNRSLDQMGMDSLMAMELLLKARKQFQVDIPPMALASSVGTISGMGRIILDHLGFGVATEPGEPMNGTGTGDEQGPAATTMSRE